MSDALTEFRKTFTTTIGRDTSPAELARHVAVLDDLLKWCEAPKRQLAPRPTGGKTDVLQFEHTEGRFVACTIRVSRSAGGTLEVYPPTGRDLSEVDLDRVLATLNEYSRGEPLVAGDKLRIGFGALKNATARKAVLALMDELLAQVGTSAKA